MSIRVSSSSRAALALLRRPAVAVSLVALLVVSLAWAVTAFHSAQARTPDERAYAIESQLRCLVCAGESVAQSNSAFAAQIRQIVRQKIAQGESDQQILDYFRAHYGDQILESPPKQGFTSLLWLPPLLTLLAGLALLFSLARERRLRLAAQPAPPTGVERSAPDDGLSDEERERYRALLRRELALEEGYAPRATGHATGKEGR